MTELPSPAPHRIRVPVGGPGSDGSRPRVVRLIGVALVLAIALSACATSHPSSRAAVARYVRAVDRIELSLKAPLAAVTQAGSQLASAPKRTTLLGNLERVGGERALSTSLTKLKVAKAQLAAVDTPAPARRLRSLLLRLTAAEADVTHQLRLLAVFLPRFSATLAPLGPATLSLERVLAQTQAYGTGAVAALYAAKAQALRRFQRATAGIVTRLHRLRPPRVSMPQYRAELGSVTGMSAASGRLAGALAGGTPGNVTALLAAFDRAAVATRTRSAQRAQIAAIKAYNASSARLNTLSSAVAEERLRLSNSLS